MLRDRIGLITGASRGIGRATAIEAASQGARLILTARTVSGLEETAAEVQKFGGPPAKLVVCDIADQSALKGMFREVHTYTKTLDFLVNNAGIRRDALLGTIRSDQIDEVMRTNVVAMILTMQFASRLMRPMKSGSIINVASIVGRTGIEGEVVYAASKAAVIGATKSAARELGRAGIRVNAVAPGVIESDMISDVPEAKKQELLRLITVGRLGHPEEVARVICVLASDQTSYVNGQVIGIDGGLWL